MDIPAQAALLPVLSQLFAVCGRGGETAWGGKRRYPGNLAGAALQSVEPGRNRSRAGGLEECVSISVQKKDEVERGIIRQIIIPLENCCSVIKIFVFEKPFFRRRAER